MKNHDVVKQILKDTPFMDWYIENGLINISKLAKIISEKLLTKGIISTKSSIMMAIKRYEHPFKHKIKPLSFYMSDIDEIHTKINQTLFRIEKTKKSKLVLNDLYTLSMKDYVYNLTSIETESSISVITGNKFLKKYKDLINELNIIEIQANLTYLTIRFKNEEIRKPGIYYTIFKNLSWSNINVFEISTSGHEVSFLIKKKDYNKFIEIIESDSFRL